MPEKSDLQALETAIHVIRGQRVMLDSDLAEIYAVTTKQLNQQYRRNLKRFPSDFAFVLTAQEFAILKSQIVTSRLQPTDYKKVAKDAQASMRHGGRRGLPVAFTEHGALTLAGVLNSDVAVEASIRIVRAFVKLREIVAAHAGLHEKLAEMERRLDGNDEALANLFDTIRLMIEAPKPSKEREMGFHVREDPATYRIKRRTPKRGSQPSTKNSQLP